MQENKRGKRRNIGAGAEVRSGGGGDAGNPQSDDIEKEKEEPPLLQPGLD
jgi:hypothetical protein